MIEQLKHWLRMWLDIPATCDHVEPKPSEEDRLRETVRTLSMVNKKWAIDIKDRNKEISKLTIALMNEKKLVISIKAKNKRDEKKFDCVLSSDTANPSNH